MNPKLGKNAAELDVERWVLQGVMTDCCVDTTTSSAFNRGYETWIVGEACGTAMKKQDERGLAGSAFAFREVADLNHVKK